MARFYGVVEGSRGQATRCGTPRSGLMAKAQSFSGGVWVEMSDHNGQDWVTVYATNHGVGKATRTLYDGPVAALTHKPPTP